MQRNIRQNLLSSRIANPVVAPFSEQSVLLFPEGMWQEENKKGHRVFGNGSSILAYYLFCKFSLMSNRFHGCLKMTGLLRHLPELCLLCRNTENKLVFKC